MKQVTCLFCLLLVLNILGMYVNSVFLNINDQSNLIKTGYTFDPSAHVEKYILAHSRKHGKKINFKSKYVKTNTCCQICPSRFYQELTFLQLTPDVHHATVKNFDDWYFRDKALEDNQRYYRFSQFHNGWLQRTKHTIYPNVYNSPKKTVGVAVFIEQGQNFTILGMLLVEKA